MPFRERHYVTLSPPNRLLIMRLDCTVNTTASLSPRSNWPLLTTGHRTSWTRERERRGLDGRETQANGWFLPTHNAHRSAAVRLTSLTVCRLDIFSQVTSRAHERLQAARRHSIKLSINVIASAAEEKSEQQHANMKRQRQKLETLYDRQRGLRPEVVSLDRYSPVVRYLS